jgi:hypothetical protein
MLLTRKGWVGLCPVYYDFVQGSPGEGEGICAIARWGWLNWWLNLQWDMQGFTIFCLSAINPDYQPMFCVKHTGRDENGYMEIED